MIRIVMGVFGADGGSIRLDGRPLSRDSVKLGYLPEERGLSPKSSSASSSCTSARSRA